MDVGLDMDTDMDLYITRFCEIMKAHNSAELVVTLSNKSYQCLHPKAKALQALLQKDLNPGPTENWGSVKVQYSRSTIHILHFLFVHTYTCNRFIYPQHCGIAD